LEKSDNWGGTGTGFGAESIQVQAIGEVQAVLCLPVTGQSDP